MENQISFTKMWQDDHIIQLKVSCISKNVTATNLIYTSDILINNLADSILDFCDKNYEKVLWENGTKGAGYSPYISLHFVKKDMLGHVLVEVYMELEEYQAFHNYHCHFGVETEIGALLNFQNILRKIYEIPVGNNVQLYSTE